MQELFRIKIAPFIDSGSNPGKDPQRRIAVFIQVLEETGYQTDLDAIREILHVADDHPDTPAVSHPRDRKRLEKVIARKIFTWRFRRSS